MACHQCETPGVTRSLLLRLSHALHRCLGVESDTISITSWDDWSYLSRAACVPQSTTAEGWLTPPTTEPLALWSLAFHAHGEQEAAQELADRLAQLQHPRGFVAVGEHHTTPHWPTALALLAWSVVSEADPSRYADNIHNGIDALLSIEGRKIDPTPDVGHDTQLVGWPWVNGTHSWVEPTALAVLALKAAGYREHPRVREAVRLLRDRQIQGGAWNCGNTLVLGQTQANHVQPTGTALLALADEEDPNRCNESAIRYLQRELHQGTGTSSLCWAWHALAAHDRLPESLENEIAMTTRYVIKKDPSPYKLSLLCLAALGQNSPLITHTCRTADGLVADVAS